MQAIISDIIVNQAAQNGNLQVSQLIQNNSSPQTSFMEMLNALRSQEADAPEKETAVKTSYEDKKTPEVSKDNESNEAKETKGDKNDLSVKEDSDKNQKTPAAFDKSVKQTEDNDKKILPKNQSENKPKLLNTVSHDFDEKRIDPKAQDNQKIKNQADVKNLKKALDDKNQKEEIGNKDLVDMLELEQNDAALQNALTANVSKLESKIESDDLTKKVELEVDTENLTLSENQNEILQNKLPVNEKVYALDKDSKIIVHDQRTSIADDEKPVEKGNSKAQVQIKLDNQNNATVTMELAEQTASENILSLDNQTAASDGSNFQAMLNNQIQANAPEFVKAGSLILQDNNKGTINLVLHPDDLGNVKIHLSMDGKTLSAHITVNTKEALEVFKDNAQTLREAFAKNGFETANFDVSYNGNSQNGQNQNFEGRYDGNEYWARKAYGEYLGGDDDGYIQDSYENTANSEYSINIVA